MNRAVVSREWKLGHPGLYMMRKDDFRYKEPERYKIEILGDVEMDLPQHRIMFNGKCYKVFADWSLKEVLVPDKWCLLDHEGEYRYFGPDKTLEDVRQEIAQWAEVFDVLEYNDEGEEVARYVARVQLVELSEEERKALQDDKPGS